jgi:hypothetical protein
MATKSRTSQMVALLKQHPHSRYFDNKGRIELWLHNHERKKTDFTKHDADKAVKEKELSIAHEHTRDALSQQQLLSVYVLNDSPATRT